MYTGISAIAVAAAAAATVVGCASHAAPEAVDVAHTVNSAPPAAAAVAKAGANTVAMPPNADGDPRCPATDAWGTNPFGAGIVVTYSSDDTEPVTVLVRTQTGSDRAQRTLLGPGELRLFEFVDIDPAAVSDVLIMTNTRRCYVTADPAALG
ncbi:hypothetical protein [Mycobacterium sp. MMS18-G62]